MCTGPQDSEVLSECLQASSQGSNRLISSEGCRTFSCRILKHGGSSIVFSREDLGNHLRTRTGVRASSSTHSLLVGNHFHNRNWVVASSSAHFLEQATDCAQQ